MEAMSGVADLVGPALGSITMEVHIWIPFLLATISFALMFVPISLIDAQNKGFDTEDDRSTVSRVISDEAERRPLMRDEDALPSESGDGAQDTASGHLFSSKLAIYTITFGSFFLISLARDSNNFLVPWVSWRFDESMATVSSIFCGLGFVVRSSHWFPLTNVQAGFLFTLRAVVSSALLFVFLPMASNILSRSSRLGQGDSDLLLSTISLLIACLGSSLMGFSPGVWPFVVGFAIATIGSGTTVTLRAFLAATVDRAYSGRLFAAIAAMSTVGNVVGMPVMGAVYTASISRDTKSIGLPFVVSAVSASVSSPRRASKANGSKGVISRCHCGSRFFPSQTFTVSLTGSVLQDTGQHPFKGLV